MSKSSLLIAILASLSLTLFAAACGGDDDDGGGGDEGEITEAIERAATEDSEEVCTEVQTQAFNEQTEFETGEAATETCVEDAGNGDTAAESVEVSEIEVDGDSATAQVAFEGAGLDGQVLAISLVKEDGNWKLDSLDEFVEFDQAAFASALVEQASADDETPQQVIDCVETQVTNTPAEQVQSAYLSGDESELLALFGSCFQGQ